jgi:hypothetical protein
MNNNPFSDERPKKGEAVDNTDMFETTVTVIEKPKTFVWSRLFTKEEVNIEKGDIVTIKHVPSGEEFETTFACYDKNDTTDYSTMDIKDYNPEDNKKTLCLLVDLIEINNNDDIKFIRTLFKTGNHYEHQLLKKTDLVFEYNGESLEYNSINF